MKDKAFGATTILVAILTLANPLFADKNHIIKDGFEDRPSQVTGRILLSLTMPLPEADRAAIIANAAILEAEGLIVAEDGSAVVFPHVSPAGWLVRFGSAETFAAADGSFSLDLEGVSGYTGYIYHPSHEDDLAIGSFTRADLVPEGEVPTAVVLELPFDGPCDMTIGPDNPAHCQAANNIAADPNDTLHALMGGHDTFVLIADAPMDTYPPTPRESFCEILDGWIDSDTSALGSYFGSTCFNRVVGGLARTKVDSESLLQRSVVSRTTRAVSARS